MCQMKEKSNMAIWNDTSFALGAKNKNALMNVRSFISVEIS